MSTINGVVLADLHVGAFDLEKQYREVKEGFLTYIKELKHLDLIVIAGDFFDKLFPLNSLEAVYAMRIMSEIAKVCKEKVAPLRIVYGTESHDSHQYDIFKPIFESYQLDYEIITRVKKEELFGELDILYIPEEYIENRGDYYKNFFEKQKEYDFIFGHGIIREGMKEAALNLEMKDSKRKKPPVFGAGELKRICRGCTFFGHYHVNCEMLEDVFYVGSYSRWIHGEDPDKGFYHFTGNSETGVYDCKFIKNQNAEIYQTISFGYNNDIFKNIDILEERLGKLDKMIKSGIYDHVRFEFNVPENCENPEYVIRTIKNHYRNNDSVKANITHGYIEKQKEEKKKELDRENEKFSFIFDKSMPKEDMLSTYISIDFDKEIPAERISRYLYKPFEEIISDEE